MLSASKISEAIRMKRKKLKEDGVENMIDTAPGPQMNPQDIYNQKLEAHADDMLDLPEKSEAPSDPADADVKGSSQELDYLRKKMALVQKIFDRL